MKRVKRKSLQIVTVDSLVCDTPYVLMAMAANELFHTWKCLSALPCFVDNLLAFAKP